MMQYIPAPVAGENCWQKAGRIASAVSGRRVTIAMVDNAKTITPSFKNGCYTLKVRPDIADTPLPVALGMVASAISSLSPEFSVVNLLGKMCDLDFCLSNN